MKSHTLFTETYLRGMHDSFVDAGQAPPFANDKIASEVFAKVANEHKLPEVLESHLAPEVNISLGTSLLKHAHELAKAGHGPSATTIAMSKQASSMDLGERAVRVAQWTMQKFAEEGSLNSTGANTPESAPATSAVAALDARNRSVLQYLVGAGKTDMPEGGVVGRQMPHPEAPQGPAINNSLTHLDKQAQQKVANAATFVNHLKQRNAPVTTKLVLASAVLADAGAAGIEAMRHIATQCKTASELDGMLDSAMAGGGGDQSGMAPDPQLVAAIEAVLKAHGIIDDGDADDKAPPSAGGDDQPPAPKEAAAKAFMDKMKGKAPAAPASKAAPKEASLLSILKAAGEGSLNSTGANTPESAAKDSATAKLDLENRKPEEYLNGQGKTDLPNAGHVGAAMDAPKGPERVNPDNTLTREMPPKAASFEESVKAASATWGPKLPATMGQNEKVAHIMALAGMPEEMRAEYVTRVSQPR